ncbi:hypothetical protein B0A50_05373 [Salinomyces thailandicus]|uniref:Uncharacterized protein n=1 Tax=Salinomyces thailandicus TaxID=706561 RepID=A0A4U0TU85_9PEZI|nr:hypothetical protein B0A50_05373 [Salinomyces thailandica]
MGFSFFRHTHAPLNVQHSKRWANGVLLPTNMAAWMHGCTDANAIEQASPGSPAAGGRRVFRIVDPAAIRGQERHALLSASKLDAGVSKLWPAFEHPPEQDE